MDSDKESAKNHIPLDFDAAVEGLLKVAPEETAKPPEKATPEPKRNKPAKKKK